MKTKMYVNWYDQIVYTEEEYKAIKGGKLSDWVNDYCTFEQFMDETGFDYKALYESTMNDNRDYLDELREDFKEWCENAVDDELKEDFEEIEKDF